MTDDSMGNKCPRCKGYGLSENQTAEEYCPDCNGTGVAPTDDVVERAKDETKWAIKRWANVMSPEQLTQAIFDAPALRAALAASQAEIKDELNTNIWNGTLDHWRTRALVAEGRLAAALDRRAIIEECARVVKKLNYNYFWRGGPDSAMDAQTALVEAIRALAQEPGENLPKRR